MTDVVNINTREYWDDRYKGRNTPQDCLAKLPHHKPLYDAIVDRMRWGTGLVDILDLGCGPGQVAWLYVQRYGLPKIGSYTGVDFSEEAEKGWKAWTDPLRASFEFCRRDLWDPAAAFKDRLKFDLIVCTEVLEHLTDDIGLVKAMRRLVKVGGRIVISVPVRPSIKSHLRHYVVLELAVPRVIAVAPVIVRGVHQRQLGVHLIVPGRCAQHDAGLVLHERPVVLRLAVEDPGFLLEGEAGVEGVLRLQ